MKWNIDRQAKYFQFENINKWLFPDQVLKLIYGL